MILSVGHVDAYRGPGIHPGGDEKVVILEKSEEGQVDAEADPKQPPAFPVILLRTDEPPHGVIEYRAEGNQGKESPVPPSVEKVARNEQEHILRLEVALEYKPVQPEYSREKEIINERGEDHGPLGWPSRFART